MNTCGTCKYRGKEIILDEFMSDNEIPSGFFLCDRIKHDAKREYLKGQSAIVQDGSGYYAALCVESDFGCIKWESK